jgi:hypothetical protein
VTDDMALGWAPFDGVTFGAVGMIRDRWPHHARQPSSTRLGKVGDGLA